MQTNVQTAVDIISSALTFGINPSLEPIQRICALLDHPEKKYTCIQVAGTNGKSSTCRYLTALLRASGHATGLYTSPELVSITDRIEIDGSPVDEDSFAQAVIHVHKTALKEGLELTEFELITAAALWIFAQSGIEYAVLEVGLGGRWDATTVVHPQLVILTGVDLDHTAILGTTISEIAGEKAAIIKQGTRVVAAPTDPSALQVFKKRAADMHASFVEVPAASVQEPGSYQAQNKLTALSAAQELLGYSFMDTREAQDTMDATVIPGRLEVVHKDPLVLIDAAHNPASARTLAAALELPSEAMLLLAVLADKDAGGIIEALAPSFAQIIVTQTSSPRAIPAEGLAALVQKITGSSPRVFDDPQSALTSLLQQRSPIVATGSITLAGEVKRFFLQ